jgi:acetyl-CoA carboxylase biotin carboxyl carrier protein
VLIAARGPQEPMTFDEIKQLIEIIRQHDLSEFEFEGEGFKLRIRTQGSTPVVTMGGTPAAPQTGVPAGLAPPGLPVAPTPQPSGNPTPPQPPAASDDAAEEVELAVVKSPIVGTFYATPEPGAKPFVEVGQVVRKNQVLCIIEAMKLMNEITSEYEGELVKVYVENGQPVQYGERLFAIRAR